MKRYVEFAPPPALRSQVICLWRHTFSGAGPHRHLILPDGCVDVVMMGSSPPEVVGPDTKAALLSLDEPTEIVGIRLMPGSAASVLGEDVRSILDQTVPLAELRPDAGAELHERLLSLPGWQRRLALLRSAVVDRPHPQDERIADAVAQLARRPRLTVDALASSYGLSPRHLLRLFETHVGYGPKTLARVFRLQRALARARRGMGSLAELALDAGYADQSHMNREFRELASSLPSGLLMRPSTVTMSDLFKTAFDHR